MTSSLLCLLLGWLAIGHRQNVNYLLFISHLPSNLVKKVLADKKFGIDRPLSMTDGGQTKESFVADYGSGASRVCRSCMNIYRAMIKLADKA